MRASSLRLAAKHTRQEEVYVLISWQMIGHVRQQMTSWEAEGSAIIPGIAR
jgi:hypothetical protein